MFRIRPPYAPTNPPHPAPSPCRRHAHPARLLAAALLVLAPALGGCGDLFEDSLEGAIEDAENAAGAATEPTTAATDAGFPAADGIVVVGSDFMATTLSQLATDGSQTAPAFLDSGSTRPGLSTAFSGDVAVASSVGAVTEIAVVDRFNSVLTLIDPADRSVRGQVSLGAAGYGVNPADYLSVAADKAYVARYGLVFGGGGLVAGDDLLVVDPTGPTTGTTIPLTEEAAPAGATDGTTYARPFRLLAVGDYVYVLLHNFTADFFAGEGAVVVIDPATDEIVNRVVLTGKSNCGGAVYSAPASSVYVVCGGAFSDADRMGRSGVVVLDASTPATPAVSRTIEAADLAERPLGQDIALLHDHRVAVLETCRQDVSTFEVVEPDTVVAVDVTASTGSEVLLERPVGGSCLTALHGDPAHARLYVGSRDVANPQVLVYKVSAPGQASVLQFLRGIPQTDALPPLQIAGY